MSLFELSLAGGRPLLRLGDVYEVTKRPRGLDTTSSSTIPFAPMEAIPQGGAYAPNYSPRKPSEIRSGTYFERGDVLVAKITPSFENGKQALTTALPAPFGFATTEIIPLRPSKEGHDRRLMFFYLLHPDVRHHLAQRMEGTTGRQRVPQEVLLDLPFPKFDPEEQAPIADSLEMIQRLSAVEVRSIQAAGDLKRAAMQTVFTRGLRGEPQKQTDIGPVPVSWELVPFANAVSLKRGFDLPVAQRRNGDIPVFGSNGIVGRHDEHRTDIPIPGVMVGRSGSVGRVSFSAGPYWPLNTTLYTTDFFGNDQRFISYFLDQFDFSRFSSGVSVPTLNRNSFARVTVAVPPINEQREIVSILDAIDRTIDLHRRKRAALDDLFKSLLHKLMTREIQVDKLDVSSITES